MEATTTKTAPITTSQVNVTLLTAKIRDLHEAYFGPKRIIGADNSLRSGLDRNAIIRLNTEWVSTFMAIDALKATMINDSAFINDKAFQVLLEERKVLNDAIEKTTKSTKFDPKNVAGNANFAELKDIVTQIWENLSKTKLDSNNDPAAVILVCSISDHLGRAGVTADYFNIMFNNMLSSIGAGTVVSLPAQLPEQPPANADLKQPNENNDTSAPTEATVKYETPTLLAKIWKDIRRGTPLAMAGAVLAVGAVWYMHTQDILHAQDMRIAALSSSISRQNTYDTNQNTINANQSAVNSRDEKEIKVNGSGLAKLTKLIKDSERKEAEQKPEGVPAPHVYKANSGAMLGSVPYSKETERRMKANGTRGIIVNYSNGTKHIMYTIPAASGPVDITINNTVDNKPTQNVQQPASNSTGVASKAVPQTKQEDLQQSSATAQQTAVWNQEDKLTREMSVYKSEIHADQRALNSDAEKLYPLIQNNGIPNNPNPTNAEVKAYLSNQDPHGPQ